MTIKVPGYTTLTGSPKAILHILEQTRIWDNATRDDYIQSIVEAVERLWGYRLEVTGETYEERAESLLRELAKHDLITIIEEEKK